MAKKRKKAVIVKFPKNTINFKNPNIYDLVRCETQDKTRDYVKKVLDFNGIEYFEDKAGNVYNLTNKDVPLLSAHMDTVMREEDMKLAVKLVEDNTGIIATGGICGGDDKCGVYIVLKVLVEKKYSVNFIFSTDEEIGCVGIRDFIKNEDNVKDLKENCLYCLVLDRKGNTDIICNYNYYGTKEFEDTLKEVSKKNNFRYTPVGGVYSDADYISEFMSTANLSVGYYNPHSSKEYIDINDMNMAKYYVDAILEEVTERFEPEDKIYSYYDTYYGSYDYSERSYPYYNGTKTFKSSPNGGYYSKYIEELYGKDYVECQSCGEINHKSETAMITSWYGLELNLCLGCAFDVVDALDKEMMRKQYI